MFAIGLSLAALTRPGWAAEADLVSAPSLHPASQLALSRGAAWRAFQSRYGVWSALWNERTGSPHLASGPAIPLASFRDDAEGADRAVRGFVAAHPELFGSPSLELLHATRAGRVWYVSYRQTVAGVPVLFEDWEFRVSAGGALMAFRADAHRVPAGTNTHTDLPALVARDRGCLALGLEPAPDPASGELALVPVERDEGTEYRLVERIEARSESPPTGVSLLVDAATGEVLWRHDRARHLVSGQVTAEVHLGLPSAPTTTQPLVHAIVTVGDSTDTTDTSGNFAVPSSEAVTLTTGFRGPYCDVNRFDGIPDALFSQTVPDPSNLSIAWTSANSLDAERDVYYHVNRAHDSIVAIDPAFTLLDYPILCGVNLAGTCDAVWDGNGIYFFFSGSACNNPATFPDVIYHEYSHARTDLLYIQLGQSFGMYNGALHEGLADAFSCFLRDDPVVGRDFLGPGTTLRTLVNSNQWPRDHNPAAQQTGLILGGALWSLRQSLGLPLASRLSQFALYGKPDAIDDGAAMAEFFLELLIADDDNGDLADGTPHSAAILAAFNPRGIGTGWFLQIAQEPPEDRPFAGPYPVFANVSTTSPIGALATVRVVYSVNGGAAIEIPMTTSGGGDYSAAIPAPQGTIVRYYLRATDSFGATRTDPPFELGRTHLFLAGPATLVVKQEAELPYGWTIGDDGDTATGGVWTWGDPNGTVVNGQQCQPEADHGSAGIMCFFTGQAMVGSNPFTNDVDGGATTLLTDVLDARSAGMDPVVEYYRWFSNDLGSSMDDPWRVWITNDLGATWVPVENTTVSDNSWRRVAFFLRDYVTPTDEVMLRFTAEDVGAGSLVEAAVDDVHIWRFDVPIIGPPVDSTFALAVAAAPNPFATEARLTFSLPRAGRATLSVLDLQGRRVRVLGSASFDAGPHIVPWDGRDDAGNRVASGLYLVRLETEDRAIVRRIVRI